MSDEREESPVEYLQRSRGEFEGLSARQIARRLRAARREEPKKRLSRDEDPVAWRIRWQQLGHKVAILDLTNGSKGLFEAWRSLVKGFQEGTVDVNALADRVGVSPSTLRAWGRLERVPKLESLLRLARVPKPE